MGRWPVVRAAIASIRRRCFLAPSCLQQRALSGCPPGCPAPEDVFVEQGFADLPLDGRVLRGIEIAVGEQARLTKVQQVVFQLLLSKNQARWPDLLLKAHTGTGKTLAFLVPALERLLSVSPSANQGGLRMLVVAPTRELVLQLAHVTHTLLQGVGPALRSSFVSGGCSLKEDVERLQVDMPHILIGTPGRIVKHLQGTPNFVRALSSVETLVLDEADHLLGPTFIYQVDYIVRCLPDSPKPQTIMCSATFSAPVRQFAFRSLRADFQTLDLTTAGQQDDGSVSRETSEVVGKVQQVLMRYRPDCFVEALLGALAAELRGGKEGNRRRVLLLFPTVRWLQFFYVLLKHHAGLPGLWAVHSRLPDDRRRARVALFSRGAPPIHGVLFATDLAARGLDFDVDAVIQVGPPGDREQYVHRAGRTGRLAAKGRSILLTSALEEAAVLEDLQGLDIQEELPPSLEAFPREADAIPISAATLAALAGWWDNPPIAASGDYFFSGIITYYLHRRKHFRITADAIVRFAADVLRSAAYPVDEQGLPFVPSGLERSVRKEDPLSVLQSAPASVRNQWAQALTRRKRNEAVEEDSRGDVQNAP